MSKNALVIGGTGPTGPYVVDGLLDRDFEVSIFHSGAHEVPFAGEVEHIHGDPHFPDTISDALGARSFDVVVAQYGRLRHLVAHFSGRCEQFIGIGGATALNAHPTDERWGGLGRPAIQQEEQRILEDDEGRNKFGFRMAEALRKLHAAHEDGAFQATYIGYPILYGPRQPGSREWTIVRRVLEGRRRIILPDGGLKLESRGFVLNVAEAPLLAIDRSSAASGRTFIVCDREVHTVRQRIEFIARYLGSDVELVDIPYDFAKPMWPLYRNRREHRVTTSRWVREELGYVDKYTADEALAMTIDWLVEHRPEPGGEVEQQLGDPFDYAAEDRLIDNWRDGLAEMPSLEYEVPEYAHIYRHPKQPNEAWTRPSNPSQPS